MVLVRCAHEIPFSDLRAPERLQEFRHMGPRGIAAAVTDPTSGNVRLVSVGIPPGVTSETVRTDAEERPQMTA